MTLEEFLDVASMRAVMPDHLRGVLDDAVYKGLEGIDQEDLDKLIEPGGFLDVLSKYADKQLADDIKALKGKITGKTELNILTKIDNLIQELKRQ